MPVSIEEILDFWFQETGPEMWFARDVAFDAKVGARLADGHRAAAGGRLGRWREMSRGCVALCILLDQVPRNIFRDTARAFATDAEARRVARHAIDNGLDLDRSLSDDMRLFLYMPLEHSEDVEDQRLSVRLVAERIETVAYRDYAKRHREIVERFGRFPHRNALLGRESTPDEIAFLSEEDSSF